MVQETRVQNSMTWWAVSASPPTSTSIPIGTMMTSKFPCRSIAALAGARSSAAETSVTARSQGLTLVNFSAQRKNLLRDTSGAISRYMGHNSSQTGHKTAHIPKRLRLT